MTESVAPDADSATKPTAVDISICICTYKRPLLLDALLSGLQQQDEVSLRLEIVVADNDPENSALPVLGDWIGKSRLPLRAIRVPTPNISMARNACVQAARGDWIAFIDDDEVPSETWIRRLIETQKTEGADVVFGPVLSILPASTPSWIIEGGFFDRPRHPSGTPAAVSDMRTGNVLVRRSLLEGQGLPFEPDFGRTGGEDTILFTRLRKDGCSMVWCDEAIVSETISPDRTTLDWLMRRSFRSGQSFVYAQLGICTRDRRLHAVRRIAIDAMKRLPGSVAAIVFFLPFSRARAFRNMRHLSRNLGILLALSGHKYQEYRH